MLVQRSVWVGSQRKGMYRLEEEAKTMEEHVCVLLRRFQKIFMRWIRRKARR